jgi:glycosyltransferase involved in cell wall biosynthesis
MAAGCPVVASDLPGLREAVVDGESGRLSPPRDAHALACVLRELLADPEQLQHLSAAATKRSARYSVGSIGARYVALLDDVRARRDPRSAASLEEVVRE